MIAKESALIAQLQAVTPAWHFHTEDMLQLEDAPRGLRYGEGCIVTCNSAC